MTLALPFNLDRPFPTSMEAETCGDRMHAGRQIPTFGICEAVHATQHRLDERLHRSMSTATSRISCATAPPSRSHSSAETVPTPRYGHATKSRP